METGTTLTYIEKKCNKYDIVCLCGCSPNDNECIARYSCKLTADYDGCMAAFFSTGTECAANDLSCCPVNKPNCHK